MLCLSRFHGIFVVVNIYLNHPQQQKYSSLYSNRLCRPTSNIQECVRVLFYRVIRFTFAIIFKCPSSLFPFSMVFYYILLFSIPLLFFFYSTISTKLPSMHCKTHALMVSFTPVSQSVSTLYSNISILFYTCCC